MNVDRAAATICVDKVRKCIPAVPHLTSPHRDGWRMEHFEAFARDGAFASVFTVFINKVATVNIPSPTADYLASATLLALLKKNEEDTQALRELMGPDFVLPIRPLAMACVFMKLVCKCVLYGIQGDIAEVIGPFQYVVGCKGGCESLPWTLQVAMEADPDFAQAVMDAINGFNALERQAIRVTIMADPRLRSLYPRPLRHGVHGQSGGVMVL